MKLIDLTGKRFGKLIVLERTALTTKAGQIYWRCLCDCGKENRVKGHVLRAGNAKSCGKCPRVSNRRHPDREYAIWKTLYTYMRNRDRKYGGRCNIDLQTFIKLSKLPCHYCGVLELNTASDAGKSGKKYSETIVRFNGLDRISSNYGYVNENVVPCCQYCNRSKNVMSPDEYHDFIARVYNHLCK